MPTTYDTDAVAKCYALYLKFNGSQHERIEAEMQREYPAWRKQNLYDRGGRQGWISKYNWEAGLKQHQQTQALASTLSTAERIAYQIDCVRDRIFEQGQAANWADINQVWAHERYCKLSVDAHKTLRESRESLHNASVFLEKILEFLEVIAPDLWRQLIGPDVIDPLLARLAAHYGEKPTT